MRLSSRFENRKEAGRELAKLISERDLRKPVVMALPRGGVPVAFEVARALWAPLEVFVVRKLGHPLNPEFAIGATTEGGFTVMNSLELRDSPGLNELEIELLIAQEQREIERRVELYRGSRPRVDVRGTDLVIVDDGLATGMSALAAGRALREEGARRIILAAPVCAATSCRRLAADFDEIHCLIEPEEFFAVGPWYKDFPQLDDKEVLDLLDRSRAELAVDHHTRV